MLTKCSKYVYSNDTAAPTGTPTHRISSFLGPKNTKVLLFPYREICTHTTLRTITSLHSEDRTLRLCEVSGRALHSRIPETRCKSTLTSSRCLSRHTLSQFHHSRYQWLVSSTLDARCAENPTHVWVDYSIAASLHQHFGVHNIANPDVNVSGLLATKPQ
jgi:hypothetical protein